MSEHGTCAAYAKQPRGRAGGSRQRETTCTCDLWKKGERPLPLASAVLFEQTRNGFRGVLMSRTDANFPAETTTRRPMAWRLFGPTPIMEGEDIALYDDLLTRISTAVKPKDILEDIWVREVIDLTWETFRLRRLKWTLLTAAAGEGLTKVLGPLIGWGQANVLASAWAARKPRAIKRVKKILASADLSVDAI